MNGRGTEVNPFFRLYNKKIYLQNRSGEFLSMPTLFDTLLNSKRPVAFLTVKETMMHFPEYFCDITEAIVSSQPLHRSFAVPKNWPYKDLFNFSILKMFERGTLNLMHKKYLELDMNCLDDHDTDRSLSLVKLVSLFAVLGTGIISSLLFIVIEIYFSTKVKGSHSAWLTKQTTKLSSKIIVGSDNSEQKKSLEFEDELKKIMFKWGILNREAFLDDYSKLVKAMSNSKNN